MSQIDLEINRRVRKVLVRHWIDLGRIGIHSANGSLTLRGTITCLAGVSQELDASGLENIFREINRIENVKRVSTQFENWVEMDGTWKKVEKPSSSIIVDSPSPGGQSFTLRDSKE